MEKKFALATTVLALMMGSVAAVHTGTHSASVEPRPGFVDASSPLYGLDVAFDNAAVQLGLGNASGVAFERASEVSVAVQNNNSQAAEKALSNLNSIAEAATGNTTGLAKAEAVLSQVRGRVPEQALTGIDNALSNIRGAQKRIPDGVGPTSSRP